MADAYIGNTDAGKVLLPFGVLKRHFIALGSSGSGKTVLCKVLIEEAVRNKIPSIIVDPQGDLASLALIGEGLEKRGVTEEMTSQYEDNSRVVIFTPCSSKGIPVCINPLNLPESKVEEEELVSILDEISNSVSVLLGYKSDDKAESVRSFLYHILEYCYHKKKKLNDFEGLIDFIEKLPSQLKNKTRTIISDKETELLVKKLNLLTTGGKRLLFNFGFPLNIDSFVKDGQTNIFYLNTLSSESEKQFFLSNLVTNLYHWMLEHPSKNLQLLFYVDEISEFLPAGARKPPAKEILNLLYKQARKYGIGCIASTQNPGDIDYKAFAQFNSWAIGRLAVKQDIAKVKTALSSVTPKFSEVLEELPKLKSSEFFLFSPDYDDNIVKFKTRYLITQHKTLAAEDLKDLMSAELRGSFEKVKRTVKKRGKTSNDYVRVNVSKEELHEIIKKLKKKTFVLFGSLRERVDYVNLLFVPMYFCVVRRAKKALFKKKLEEFNICFDALTGDIVELQDSKMKRYVGFSKLVGMKEIELGIVRELFKRKRMLNLAELYNSLKISGGIVKSSLNKLMKDNLIMSKKDKFGLNFNMKFSLDISKQASELQSKCDEEVEGRFLEEQADFSKLKKTFETFFTGTEIVGNELLYYPIYEVKLSSKKKSRLYRVNGVNGKVTG
ncbi:DUF853 family protein [Candidatus Woesearchaeota archaeon]|nr:DUF853 family protein [Candidatus Woesearchaeota archaeon]